MSDRDTGGSAFPKAVEYADSPPDDGMTLRDYFAGQALPSCIQRGIEMGIGSFEKIASTAYEIADAVLKERAK